MTPFFANLDRLVFAICNLGIAGAIFYFVQNRRDLSPLTGNVLLVLAGLRALRAACQLILLFIVSSDAAFGPMNIIIWLTALVAIPETLLIVLYVVPLALRAPTLEQLHISNRRLYEFAASASHDLRAPLVTIVQFAGVLEAEYGRSIDGKGQQYIAVLKKAADRMQRLILDLLDYGRIDAGNNKTAFNVSDAVDGAKFALHAQIMEKHAAVIAHPLPVLVANRSVIELLFQNLIQNSLKFASSSRPTVEIFAAKRGKFWEFRVVDNGIGIEAQYLEQALKPFERLHGREKYEGSGLGLAICQRICEDMGGRIWITNSQPAGVTVHFTIPL